VERYFGWLLVAARLLVAVVFLLNGFGIIDQTIPAREMLERGVPAGIVPLAMFAGRTLEILTSRSTTTVAIPPLRQILWNQPSRPEPLVAPTASSNNHVYDHTNPLLSNNAKLKVRSRRRPVRAKAPI
jgi:hypothetical protein